MPTISLGKPKQKRPSYNRAALQIWYNCKMWRDLRANKFANNPLCEVCLLKDPPVVRPTEEVHHIIPIDIQNPDEFMIYDYSNLLSLCAECHHAIHDKYKHENELRQTANSMLHK